MKLRTLKIQNFRSYKQPIAINIDDFTAIIGKNDVGKSTLLEALEIYFNSQTVKIDQADSCAHSQNKIVEITCVFEELPASLTIDARSQTTLAGEHLLNADKCLEIVKRYDCKGKTIKPEILARACCSADERVVDLIKLKNAELKVRARDLECDLADVDERSNAALRAAIRQQVGDLPAEERLVPLNEEDGKKIWDQLERELPIFALFQADRPSKDDDPEVADPMKVAIASAIKEVEEDLDAIKEKVRTNAIDVAQRTLAKLKKISPDLAQELTPNFKAEPKWDGFKLMLTSDDQIPINKRGSGVRRLVLLSFFQAETERRRSANKAQDVIFAIEEPESSQHPDNQAMLIRTLLAMADDPHTQILITTHIPAVAAQISTSSVRLVTKHPEGPRIEHGAADVYEKVTETLGVFPDKRAKVGIFVEGPNDVEFLRHASRLRRQSDQTLIDLDTDHRIAFIPMGGGTLQHWVDHRYLLNAGLAEVHIYDSDNPAAPKYQRQVDEVNNRGNGDRGFSTTKREMENYIHSDAINMAFGFRVDVDDLCDLPALVAEQIHSNASDVPWAELDDATQKYKISKAKRRLNRDAMSNMTLAQLNSRDTNGEIQIWLEAIRDLA